MHNNYPKPIVLMHWVTFILVAVVYLTSGDPTESGITGQIHVIGGMLIFVLLALRLILIFANRKQLPQQTVVSPLQFKLFKIMKWALYLSLLIVPIMGWFALSSITDQYSIFSTALPLIPQLRDIEFVAEIHELLGNVFITLAGLHAAAALLHHFVLKDRVLKSMTFRGDK